MGGRGGANGVLMPVFLRITARDVSKWRTHSERRILLVGDEPGQRISFSHTLKKGTERVADFSFSALSLVHAVRRQFFSAILVLKGEAACLPIVRSNAVTWLAS
jgi:hypothetical protein